MLCDKCNGEKLEPFDPVGIARLMAIAKEDGPPFKPFIYYDAEFHSLEIVLNAEPRYAHSIGNMVELYLSQENKGKIVGLYLRIPKDNRGDKELSQDSYIQTWDGPKEFLEKVEYCDCNKEQ
jgi:hypothetical protein